MDTDSKPSLPSHSSDVTEELRRIRLALDTVYSSTNQTSSSDWYLFRDHADKYLTSFQTTALAWVVCDRLLQEPGDRSASDQVENDTVRLQQRRFFAAQTLHKKCRSDIQELPSDSLPSLRDSVSAHLHRASVNDPALTTRLAMCISALAVQMGWTTIVRDLLENPNAAQHARSILFILRSLPEECASDRLYLQDDEYRFIMRDHLIATSPQVFQFFMAYISQPNQGTRVMEALHTWIRFVPVEPRVIADSPFLPATVHALTHPNDLLEHAADVVVEILRMYPSSRYGNDVLVRQMIPLLSRLPLEEALRSDDEDILRDYCRVVTEMGESYMGWILSEQHKDASKLVEWVLACSSIQYAEIAGITLHFWYRMVLEMEGIEPYEWRQELIDHYTPHLCRLIDLCVQNLMKFPADVAELAADEVEEIHRHRFYVAETIEDCCRLLGGQRIIDRLTVLMRQEVSQVTSPQQWQGVESCLACITAVHRFVPADEADLLPFCFELVPKLPPEISLLRSTASTAIGKFASWVAMKAELMQPLMPYLAQGLTIRECAPAAAVAIKELCECSNQSFAIADPVLSLYEQIATEQIRLEIRDELQVLEGVCRALSRHIQDTRDPGTSYLGRLVTPMGNRLATKVNDPSATPRIIQPEIERLTIVVHHMALPWEPDQGRQHPLVDLMLSLWSFLQGIVTRFPSDGILAEHLSRLHKHAMRSTGTRAYSVLLNQLMQHLVESFSRSHQSPYLYAASICITEYGWDDSKAQSLFEMVAAMASTAFSFLNTTSELTNHPDVVEEFFYLLERMIQYCPEPLILSPMLQPAIQAAVMSMNLDHPGAHKGTIKFLDSVVSYGLSLQEKNKPECKQAVEQALASEGEAVVRNVALALMGDLPGYSPQIPEILWKLNILCQAPLAQWLTSTLQSTPGIPERAKVDLLGAINTSLARDEFSLAVRGFQNACARERRLRKGGMVPQ